MTEPTTSPSLPKHTDKVEEPKDMFHILQMIKDVNPSGGFTPLDLPNLFSWHDASDSSTITTSDSNVTLWEDKSGNGIDLADGPIELGPTVATADQNGLDSLVFGVGDRSTMTNITAWDDVGATDITVAVLCRPTSIDTTGRGVVFIGEVATSGDMHILFDTDVTNNMKVYTDIQGGGGGASQTVTPVSSISANDPVSVILTRSATDAGAIINGVAGNESFEPNSQLVIGTAALNNDGRFGVGWQTSESDNFIGKVYEVITCKGVISESDKTNLTSYWQNKWGIS
jgi:hypothetical protein